MDMEVPNVCVATSNTADASCGASGDEQSDSPIKPTYKWCHNPEYLKKFEGLTIEEVAQERGHWLSEVALTYYNKEHGTDYELVDILYNTSTCAWNHINFKAISMLSGSSSELFFAEVCGNPVSYFCTTCCIMDPNDSGFEGACELCDPKCLHPRSGYELQEWGLFVLDLDAI